MARYSVPYALLKFWVGTGLRLYFRKIEIKGSAKSLEAESNTPVIVLANHQNALLDAIVLGVFTDRQINFLARAAVFKKPLHAKILSYLHMQPVYRPIDGVDVRSSNEPIFESCIARLNEGAVIGIFPEGNHDLPKRLRVLKKGAVRMAAGFGKPVAFQIFGIDYLNHARPFTSLEINLAPELIMDLGKCGHDFAQPMDLIKQTLSASMLNIADENKRLFLLKLEMLHWTNGELGFSVQRRKELLDKLSSDSGMIELLQPILNDYSDLLKHHSLSDEDIERFGKYGLIITALHAHVSKWAYLVHLPMILFQHFLESRLIDDVVFRGTFRFLYWFIAVQISWITVLTILLMKELYLISVFFFVSLIISFWILRIRGANPGPVIFRKSVMKRATSLRNAIMSGIYSGR